LKNLISINPRLPDEHFRRLDDFLRRRALNHLRLERERDMMEYLRRFGEDGGILSARS